MHKNCFFLAFLIILLIAVPATASLSKITGGAPVFIGERDLDISSGLQGCHVIGWWPNGSSLTMPPVKNVTVIRTVEDSNIAFRYTINPADFSGYTGTWYCVDKQPPRPVFVVLRPELAITFRNFDTGRDISGTGIPPSTNVTYQITTNLYQALQYRYRPDITPLDSFFTLSLTDPAGKQLQSLYTGSYGKKDTLIIPFDTKPYITTSPFNWSGGGIWNLESRNAQGDLIYPPGPYTITVRQNLNGMDSFYTGADRKGTAEASATMTIIQPASTTAPSITAPPVSQQITTLQPPAPATVSTPPAETLTTTLPAKTTYSPLPVWPVAAGIVAVALLASRKRI